MEMNFCENRLCVYWQNHTCCLDFVRVDESGSCASCIFVSIPQEIIERERKKQLLRYEQTDNLL